MVFTCLFALLVFCMSFVHGLHFRDVLNVGDSMVTKKDNGNWTVVVTGATGRSGLLSYKLLKEQGTQVRALVRNIEKAKKVLDCGECGEDQGIFVGDVRDEKSLEKAFDGADALVILTASFPVKENGKYIYPKGSYPEDIDWKGTVKQLRVANKYNLKSVTLVSSMGTLTPDSFLDKLGDGHDLFYKLNGEMVTMQSGMHYTVIKPCGLTDKPVPFGTQVGNCDNMKTTLSIVSRSSVAAAVAYGASENALNTKSVRFDMCSNVLQPVGKDDWPSLYEAAAKINICP